MSTKITLKNQCITRVSTTMHLKTNGLWTFNGKIFYSNGVIKSTKNYTASTHADLLKLMREDFKNINN